MDLGCIKSSNTFCVSISITYSYCKFALCTQIKYSRLFFFCIWWISFPFLLFSVKLGFFFFFFVLNWRFCGLAVCIAFFGDKYRYISKACKNRSYPHIQCMREQELFIRIVFSHFLKYLEYLSFLPFKKRSSIVSTIVPRIFAL